MKVHRQNVYMPTDGITNIEGDQGPMTREDPQQMMQQLIMAAIKETTSALVCKPDIEQVNNLSYTA
jgi:hypothetical protein